MHPFMLPTIDISLIGVILAIWGVIKVVFSAVMNALNFVSQKVLALVAGSKFWATAAFLAAGWVVVSLLSTALNAILASLYSMLISAPSFTSLSSSLGFVNTVFPISDFIGVITFGISCRAALFAVSNFTWAFRRVQFLYNLWSKAWKT